MSPHARQNRRAAVVVMRSLVCMMVAGTLLSGCVIPRHRPLESVVQTGRPAMGTILQVTVVAPDADQASRLTDAVFDLVVRLENAMTIWRPDGELARFNAAAGSGPVLLSSELRGALLRMVELSADTGGTFDPAVGRIVRAYAEGDVPIAPFLLIGIGAALAFDGERAALVPGVMIDPGGIGKGIALDAAAELLRRSGASGFLDFGGSSQLAVGEGPGGRGWQVLVTGLDTGSVLGTVTLSGASLSTSRARGRQGAVEGLYIDPRTGTPIDLPCVATVFARDATTADAWSTALVILGREGLDRASTYGVEAMFVDSFGIARTANFPLAEIR